MSRVKIVVFVPLDYTDKIRQALGEAGAGQIGEYSFCSNSYMTQGRSLPSTKANPYIGEPGTLEVIDEEAIEVVCDRDKAKAVIAAMRQVHPYDEVAFDIYPLIDEEEL
jgi:hypothetical protein